MPLSTLEAVQVGTELVSYVDALNVHMNYYLTVLVMWPLSMDWNTTRCHMDQGSLLWKMDKACS